MVIDCVGLACPRPVINTRKALANIDIDETICVVVDNEIATENLIKLCEQVSCKYNIVKESNERYLFYLTKGELVKSFTIGKDKKLNQVVVINSDSMGSEKTIGKKLLEMYIYTLTETENLPSSIIFYNEGVKLTCENTKTISDLEKLQKRGVKVFSCGACVDYFNGKIQVGEVTNMLNIVNAINDAKKVVTV